MKLIEFIKCFPNEEACKKHLKAFREKQGIVCTRCGCVHHYWKGYRNQWECKQCGHRTTLTSGTIFHASKMSLHLWYIALHLLTSTKNTFSACELQRQLGHKRYQPVWEMMHKIRSIMGQRDDRYTLSGEIELDEGFFTVDSDGYDSTAPKKRGRGSEAKAKVLVMVESEAVKGSNKRIKRKVSHIKMKMINDLKSETIDQEVMGAMEPESKLVTDNSTSYTNFKDMVEEHDGKVILPKEVGNELPWVHIMISNAKRCFLNVFHNIKDTYLQNYLNEFCYCFNRRNMDIFDRLLVAGASYQNTFKHRNYSRMAA